MGTATELERLVVRLVGDGSDYDRMVTGAVATVETASRKINSYASKIESAGKTIRNTGLKMTAVITLPVAGMVKSFASFDDAMTESTAIMGNISVDMRKELEQTARTLSLSAKTSATDLAKSYFYLASAGMNAEQSIKALPVVEKFATAGAFDMALATDLLTDAQSALGLSSKDAEKNMRGMLQVSDVLVKANTLANASVQQFSESLTSEAGAAIKNYNMDLNESVAILATYADRGIKAQLAGHMFGRMTRLLIKAMNDNKSAFEQMNIPIEEFSSTGKNLTAVIDGITKATEGLGPAEKAAALEALGFEARIQQAILPLLGATDKIRGYEDALKSAGGITKEVAEKQLKSFSSQMKIVWNNVIDFANDIGRILAPYIEKVRDFIKDLAEEWRGLSAESKKVIGITIGIVAALGPLLTIIGSITAAAGGLIGTMALAFSPLAISAFAAALPGILAAVLSISAAIAGIGTGIKYVIDLGKIKGAEKTQQRLSAINEEMQNYISLQKEQESILVRQKMLKASGSPAFDPNEMEQAAANIDLIKGQIKELNNESQRITKSAVDPLKNMTKASEDLVNSMVDLNKKSPIGNTEGDSWGDFGKVVKETSRINKQKLELTKSSNAAIKAENDRALKEEIARDTKYRQLVDQASMAELNNISNKTERELALHEYKFDRLKELYTEGSKELTEIERLEAAERVAILKENNYWEKYSSSMQENMLTMDSIIGDSIDSWTTQFGNFFASAIMDSDNLEKSFKNMVKGMAASLLSAIGKMIAQWIAYKVMKIATDKAVQTSAIPQVVAAAEAGALLAGINAYASAAAIPYAGWVLAPAAMAAAQAATQPMVAGVSAAMVAGLAHDGIDSVPTSGTWLLEKGERVLTKDTAAKLDDTLNNIRTRMDMGNSASVSQGPTGDVYQLHNHYDGPVFLDRFHIKEVSKMFIKEIENEKTRRGAVV